MSALASLAAATRARIDSGRVHLAALGADAARGLAAFATPQRCPECGAAADPRLVLCAACHRALPRLSFAVCAKCSAHESDASGCTRHVTHRVWPAWVYDAAAAEVVHALKFDERPSVAAALGDELARVAPPAPRPDLVLALPLHAARLRERGYNQAERLAQALAHAIGAPLLGGALERVRATPPQTRLGARDRRRNLAGAFRVREPRRLLGRRVLVVDDVMTTGATFDACLDALAAAGADAAGVALAWAQ